MKYWASAEVFQDADASSDMVRRLVLFYLTNELECSILSELEGEIGYIPVIMPARMHTWYKEIIRYHKKRKSIELRPHLDHEIFVRGTGLEQLAEYVRGIKKALPLMEKMGATQEQIEAFRNILSRALTDIHVTERPLLKPH